MAANSRSQWLVTYRRVRLTAAPNSDLRVCAVSLGIPGVRETRGVSWLWLAPDAPSRRLTRHGLRFVI